MSEEEQVVAHENERAGGETAGEEFVVPADLEAYFDRVEAEKGERAAAEAALDEAERRAAAQADRSMHLTDTAKETVNGALARIGADLSAGKDAGDALEAVKKEIARLQTEEKATLAALRAELAPAAQPAESTPPETPAAEMAAPEPATAEAPAANPADAWNTDERAAISAYLDVLDAADRAHADLMKAKRELKKIANTESDEWEIKADQVTKLEKAWRDQKADARAREQALGPIDATLVDLDVGRKAGREALRKRMTEAAPPVVPEPRDAAATSVAAEQPIASETQPDAEPANHEYARLAGELDALIGKYGPMNGMDLAFKDIMDRMARIRLGGPVQMARVSAEAQTAFQSFARDYARAVRTIKELTADGTRLTEEQARSTGVTLQKMEQAAQKLSGPMTSNLQGGMRRFADALRGADPRYDSAPLVKAAAFITEQSGRVAEATSRIRSEWDRAANTPSEAPPANPRAEMRNESPSDEPEPKVDAENGEPEGSRQAREGLERLGQALEESGSQETITADETKEYLYAMVRSLEERSYRNYQVAELRDALLANAQQLEQWQEDWSQTLGMISAQRGEAGLTAEDAETLVNAVAGRAEDAESEARTIIARIGETLETARQLASQDDRNNPDGAVLSLAGEIEERMGVIQSAVATKRDEIFGAREAILAA